jgi:G6PDH family F420-dependent oxidoreductase
VLGAIAASTSEIRIGTGVTCPLIRMHPAIVAQAAATTAALFDGRFFLGVGTGENLNEHITGERWPPAERRREMLAEAVGVMRELWRGDLTSHRGRHYTVENARLYTLPDEPVQVMVAAGGPEAAKLAGDIGDGVIGTQPEPELIESFTAAGGDGPRYGQLTVCYARSEEEAVRTALEWWPNAGLQGPMSQELPLPSHFEESAGMVSAEDIAEAVVCGPDPERIVEKAAEFVDAGFDHVYIHQVGPDQRGFLALWERELRSALDRLVSRQPV